MSMNEKYRLKAIFFMSSNSREHIGYMVCNIYGIYRYIYIYIYSTK